MLDYLTKDETTALYDNTKPGQAHWGGSGPAGKRCFECSFWTPRTYSPARDDLGNLEPRRCRKFSQLVKAQMTGVENGVAVPAEALACRYFETAERVWPLVGGRKAPKAEAA